MAIQASTDLTLSFEKSGSVYRVQEVDGGAVSFLAAGELQPFLFESSEKSRTGRWTPQDAKSSSQRFLESIFQSEILARFTSARQEALTKGTTLRLQLDLEGAEELDDLPWELLADPESSGSVSLARSVPAPGFSRTTMSQEPLRVLTLVASPTDMPPFDYDWSSDSGGVLPQRLEEASVAGLQRALSEGHFQVLHFVGYGRSNVNARYGSLFLAGQDGHARGIPAEYLAGLLRRGQYAAPRLVILEAGSRAAELNPFAETARVLVRNGIDSVIAMRRRLSGPATTSFHRELYSSLASGISIDQSLVNARRAMAQRCTAVEWDVPMLYTSSEGGGVLQAERPLPIERPSRDLLTVSNPKTTASSISAGTSASAVLIQGPGTSDGKAPIEEAVPRLRKASLRKTDGKVRKVLILAASPENLTLLRVGEEIREINVGLRRARYGKLFEIQPPLPAVRPRDLQQAMLDLEPQIVHFCGHGAGAAGLVMEDDQGLSRLVSNSALANLFRLFADKVECVVLNSCHSEEQARAISQHIRYVIGMKTQIEDRAAINFAVGFYCALGAGHPIEFAYQMGCSAIELENLPDSLAPVLLERPAFDSA